MMAAGRAAERGAKVLLLEKTDGPGKKILISGKSRCNLSNARDLSDFIGMYGPNGRFLHGVFHRFFRDDLLAFLGRYGVETKVERGGRIFPVSDDAAEVLKAFRRHLTEQGVVLATGTRATGIAVRDGRVEGVHTENGFASRRRSRPGDRRCYLACDGLQRGRLSVRGGHRPSGRQTPSILDPARRQGSRMGQVDARGESEECSSDRLPRSGSGDRSCFDPGQGHRSRTGQEKAARSGHRKPDGRDALYPFRNRRADHAPDEPSRRRCTGGGTGQRLHRSETGPHGGGAPGASPKGLRSVRQAGFPQSSWRIFCRTR